MPNQPKHQYRIQLTSHFIDITTIEDVIGNWYQTTDVLMINGVDGTILAINVDAILYVRFDGEVKS